MSIQPLTLVGAGFAVLAVVLLIVPVILVTRKLRPWRGVLGLWIAGWGFLLIGAGTVFAAQGWGRLVVPGVIVTTAGHVLQRRATSS